MEKFLVKKMARSGGKTAEVRERRVVEDDKLKLLWRSPFRT